VFAIVNVYKVKMHDSNWNKMEFEGSIQNITHLNFRKNSFVKVNDFWIALSYNELFEDKNLIGLKIAKKKGEKGVWIERKLNSNEFYFKSTQGSFVNDEKIINQITQHSL
jgi:hypothetical protein